jgi:formylglycine-generating enzyme required for sulfatase activity
MTHELPPRIESSAPPEDEPLPKQLARDASLAIRTLLSSESAETVIQRGGSFTNLPSQQAATDRFFTFPVKKFDYVGFRCAKDAK